MFTLSISNTRHTANLTSFNGRKWKLIHNIAKKKYTKIHIIYLMMRLCIAESLHLELCVCLHVYTFIKCIRLQIIIKEIRLTKHSPLLSILQHYFFCISFQLQLVYVIKLRPEWMDTQFLWDNLFTQWRRWISEVTKLFFCWLLRKHFHHLLFFVNMHLVI